MDRERFNRYKHEFVDSGKGSWQCPVLRCNRKMLSGERLSHLISSTRLGHRPTENRSSTSATDMGRALCTRGHEAAHLRHHPVPHVSSKGLSRGCCQHQLGLSSRRYECRGRSNTCHSLEATTVWHLSRRHWDSRHVQTRRD
jgi:hypothetical protein